MTHIHLIGIGGAGLSAIATVLLQQGYIISGSDQEDSATIARLRSQGATVTIGHQATFVAKPDVVVISSAIVADNVEVLAAQALSIPIIKRPAWLGQMMTEKRGVAIAGTHGKTTTTALLAWVLSQADQSPTYIIGGFVSQLGSNAAAGESDLFIIEADEYDHTFLRLKPEIAVITNLEWDHPDIYPTQTALDTAFKQFAQLVPAHGQLIGCGDDPGLKRLQADLPEMITYGLNEGNTWRAINLTLNDYGGYTFQIEYNQTLLTSHEVTLRLPGAHNVRNALAVVAVTHILGISLEVVTTQLTAFKGVERRFEYKGQFESTIVIDDYAHHPTEIEATLTAARARFGSRQIWAVFQPHTFSRTKLLRNEFAQAFDQADHVILLDIFPSREHDDGSISSQDIVKQMTHPNVHYIGSIKQAVSFLHTQLGPHNILITLGAGNVYKLGELFLGQTNGKFHEDIKN